MRFFNVISSFLNFTLASENKIGKKLYICEADFNLTSSDVRNKCAVLKDEKSLYTYFLEKRYQHDYSTIIFNSFDFTRSRECNYILLIVCNDFVFLDAIFTVDQVKLLLLKNYDLSKCTYRTVTAALPGEYRELYEMCLEKKFQNALKGLRVDFSDCDFSQLEDNYLSSCIAESLLNSTVSQPQFDRLLAEKNTVLKLSGIDLAKIDITGLIQNHRHRIRFDTHCLTSGDPCIYFANTSIQNAIMDIESLALCAMTSNLYLLFEVDNLVLTIKQENGLVYDYFEIQVDGFISNLCRTQYTARVSGKQSFFNLLCAEIEAYNPLNKLDFEKMSNGKKLLWVGYCAHYLPNSSCAKTFLRFLSCVNAPIIETTCAA